MLVDSHCHLDFPELSADLDAVVQRASANDVGFMQTICTRLSDFDKLIKIAEKYPNISASVGVHPNNVAEDGVVSYEDLLAYTRHDKIIGIGETGLDYHYETESKSMQLQSFINHIRVSRETGLPLIVHSRDADEDTVDILKSEMKKGKFPALIHCFSSTQYLADSALTLGIYISISGIVTFKNAKLIQDVVKIVPVDKLLVETDAPYLAPVPYRGKSNEPAYVKHTADFIANLKSISYEELAEITTKNFFSLFSKAKMV